MDPRESSKCCKHDEGFWALTKAYMGYAQGDRWCCLAGCGFALPFNPDEYEDYGPVECGPNEHN